MNERITPTGNDQEKSMKGSGGNSLTVPGGRTGRRSNEVDSVQPGWDDLKGKKGKGGRNLGVTRAISWCKELKKKRLARTRKKNGRLGSQWGSGALPKIDGGRERAGIEDQQTKKQRRGG